MFLALTYQGRCTAEREIHQLFILLRKGAKLLTSNDPGCLLTVHTRQILLEPIDLLVRVGAKWPRVHAFRTANFVRANESIANISLGVQLDEVSHAVVEGVPEVSNTTRHIARHTIMVAEAGEVGLAHGANTDVISNTVVGGTTIVTWVYDEI